LAAEHSGGEVNGFDINEDLGAEPDTVEGIVVFTHRLRGKIVSW